MTAGTKISLYVGKEMAEALDGADNRSNRLNVICDRYLGIMSQELERLDLTRAEWGAALDALKGVTAGMTSDVGWRHAWVMVAESPGPCAKWGVNFEALASKLKEFTLAQKAAFAEGFEQYWRLRGEKLSHDKALERAGIHPREG